MNPVILAFFLHLSVDVLILSALYFEAEQGLVIEEAVVNKTKDKAKMKEDSLDIEHSLQRKAAIAWGKGTDHAGNVLVEPISDFDLNKTIFSTIFNSFIHILFNFGKSFKISWGWPSTIGIVIGGGGLPSG